MPKLIHPSKLPEYGITFTDRQRRRLEDAGEFPKRVKYSARKHGYADAEILAFIERKITSRSA